MLRLILTILPLLVLITACRPAPGAALPPTQPTSTPVPVSPTFTSQPQASPSPTTQPPSQPTNSSANADVLFVRASRRGDDSWSFNVTVAHPDTGWEDYADGWDVVLPDGTVVKSNPDDPFTRLLLHPHETEQPFTRSQSGLLIPADVTTVTVRAHDLVDGWGGQEVVVDLSQTEGPGFEVTR